MIILLIVVWGIGGWLSLWAGWRSGQAAGWNAATLAAEEVVRNNAQRYRRETDALKAKIEAMRRQYDDERAVPAGRDIVSGSDLVAGNTTAEELKPVIEEIAARHAQEMRDLRDKYEERMARARQADHEDWVRLLDPEVTVMAADQESPVHQDRFKALTHLNQSIRKGEQRLALRACLRVLQWHGVKITQLLEEELRDEIAGKIRISSRTNQF